MDIMISEKSVSVVVINYNNGRFIRTCLDALANVAEIKEVIVVDDASTDDSLEILKNYEVAVIKNEKNLGPVVARNIGAKRATGKYLLFLDSDAKLAPNYVPDLAAFFEVHPDAGVVSGKVLGDDGKRMWFNFGYDPSPIRDWLQGAVGFLGRPFTLNFVPDEVRKVDWVVEMAFMTRRDLFEKLGGLDEHFFMFFEGPDYCRRVRNLGYNVYYFPGAICKHLGGHSHSESRDRFFQESRSYYLKKYSHEK